MKKVVIFVLALCLLGACTNRTGVKGIDSPYPVESGSIKVMNAQKMESFIRFDQTINPRDGNVFISVTMQVKGVVPSAGVDEKLSDLMNGDWSLVDINYQSYPVSGVVSGDLIFEVPDYATGLQLALGPSVKIPIGTFFGEEILITNENTPTDATALPFAMNKQWAVEVTEAYWNTDAGPAITPGEHERLLAIIINLEYTGEDADITEENFIRVYDDMGRSLDFIETVIFNNGAVPDGGKDWIAFCAEGEETRHFVSGEKFNQLVLFFVGSEDAQGFVLQVDGLPPVQLDEILVIQ